MLPTPTLVRLLTSAHRLARRDRWTPDALRVHQERAVAALRRHAYATSPFYRRLHAGLLDAPLDALPILTKEKLVAGLPPAAGTRRTCLTSGSTGDVVRIHYDAAAWGTILASFARARVWAGIPLRPLPRLRTAVVASGSTRHQSGAVAAALASWWSPVASLDAGAPIPELVARLNASPPDVLVSYPSTACALAAEQEAGRLRIAPRLFMSVAEMLSREARARLRRAWGCPVVDQYATTETGCLAAECGSHGGLHLQEDLVLVEVVDADDRPVAPGRCGEKLLVTVLFNFAMPLIRYELSDRIALAPGACGCGRPFRVIDRIEGRREELLRLSTASGAPVEVHPVALYEELDALPVRAWEVICDGEGITIRLVDAASSVDDAFVSTRLRAALSRRGAVPPPIRILRTAAITRTASSKRAPGLAHRGLEGAVDARLA